jgi:hypothetical protein
VQVRCSSGRLKAEYSTFPPNPQCKENQRGAEPKVSFEIWVEKLGTEAASFKGSLRKDSGEAREWRGSFVCYRDTPLDVIRAGPQDMPPKAKDFLDINPWEIRGNGEHVDVVASQSAELMKDVSDDTVDEVKSGAYDRAADHAISSR